MRISIIVASFVQLANSVMVSPSKAKTGKIQGFAVGG
jgi:hypothetical protein